MSADASPAPEPGRPLSFALLLREPFRSMSLQLHRFLAERGHAEVRPPHGAVFQFLDDDGTRVSVLAERAQITKQSMAELVAHLERHGYVERTPDPTDRRAKLVRETARGREVYALAREFAAAAEARLARALGEAEFDELQRLLRLLNVELSRTGSALCSPFEGVN